MTPPTIEERLALLEQKVARLSGDAAPEITAISQAATSIPWWERHFGAFKDSPYYDEAMRLGAEYRRSQPTADEGEDNVPA